MPFSLLHPIGLGVTLLAASLAAAPARAADYPVAERSIGDLQADMAAGKVTSEALVKAYRLRIRRLDRAGPRLNAVIALNPDAIGDARRLDAERRAGHVRGPLHGVPILVKDNIETDDPTPTTAGSLALAGNVTRRDAETVRRLKAAGAVILGKTNLSEWANIRSSRSISGWSAVGGLVRNPYALDRTACGSSSGSGAAAAASLAAATVGTETDGSVTCPASMMGLVGLKPTVGLVSRAHVVPISGSQDTPGPMARSVADAAVLLTAMAGSDPADPATKEADARKTDYLAALDGASLRGVRLGVLTFATDISPEVTAVFRAAVERLKAEGAEVVELGSYQPPDGIGEMEYRILLTELKTELNAYLADAAPAVRTRTLADVIAFNRATPRETALFGQDAFEMAEATRGLEDPDYLKARADARRMAGPEGIDRLVAEQKLDALIAPSFGPASRVDIVAGDRIRGLSAALPAIAGYPHLTVPMGDVRGLPIGLSFIGPAWSEARLLRLGAAFERAAGARKPPTFAPSVESAAAGAFAPAAAPAPR